MARKPATQEPEAPTTITVELDLSEAQLIYTTFDQIPVSSPDGKRLAANVQSKLIQALSVVN